MEDSDSQPQVNDMANASNDHDTCTSFIPPSIHPDTLRSGASYSHFSPVPPSIASDPSIPPTSDSPPCILGIDEAGRGPVLGPMVYGCFYLPAELSEPLLRTTHHFDDSKLLTATFRTHLMRQLCEPASDLHTASGWAVEVLSARDISAGMMRSASASYNLNAQALDATLRLIQGVLDRGVRVVEVFVDTVGPPVSYQRVLQARFPTLKVRVEKKADSLFAVVSAASVVAKVTRDVALEELWRCVEVDSKQASSDMLWGSGYPSDARCTTWLKQNLDPLFGFGPECRFSWGTVKELLEARNRAFRVAWPADEDTADSHKMTDFFRGNDDEDPTAGEEGDEAILSSWYGRSLAATVF